MLHFNYKVHKTNIIFCTLLQYIYHKSPFLFYLVTNYILILFNHICNSSTLFPFECLKLYGCNYHSAHLLLIHTFLQFIPCLLMIFLVFHHSLPIECCLLLLVLILQLLFQCVIVNICVWIPKCAKWRSWNF